MWEEGPGKPAERPSSRGPRLTCALVFVLEEKTREFLEAVTLSPPAVSQCSHSHSFCQREVEMRGG